MFRRHRPDLSSVLAARLPTEPAAVEQVQINWRKVAVFAALIALVVGSWTYAARYAVCGRTFCVVAIAGTRTEVGCQWESWTCYVDTYPANEPAHVPTSGLPV